jgi:uncharacterized iron-regulated membrane protein
MTFFLQLIFVTVLLLAVPAVFYLLGRFAAPGVFRRIAYEIHLWLGIVSSLILFVVCLSGTLLTFKTEIIQFLEHDRYFIQASDAERRKTLEELVPLVEQAENGKTVRVTIPAEEHQTWVFNIKKEGGLQRKLPTGMPAVHTMLGTAYLVNPYTGESLGEQRSGVYMFFMMLTFLHRFLLLDVRTGQIIVGSATLVFLVLIVGGLCLWFPPKLQRIKNYFGGFRVRTKKGWSKFLYDFHNTLGFYALIPLAVMALTGPLISFSWYRSGFEQVLRTKPFGKVLEKPLLSKNGGDTKRNLAWDDFITAGNKLSLRKGSVKISLPQSPTGSVTFQKTGTGFFSIAAVDKVQFDQYTGEVLKSDLFDELPFCEKAALLIFPLHNGEIFGAASKVVYFVTCLIATTLPVTGLILWIRKLRIRYKRKYT